MSAPEETQDIWFERMGPTIGWLGSYVPITMKGFHVLLAHMAVMLLAVPPVALLMQFEVLPAALGGVLLAPVMVGGGASLMRIAHRHTLPPN